MRTLKRMLRLFIVAVLSLAFAVSVAACKTGNNKPTGDNTGTENNGGDNTGTDDNQGGGTDEGKPDDSVKYNVQFKNVDSAAYPDIQVSKNGTVSVTAPSKSNSIFLGWYMDKECTKLPFTMGSTKITQNTILYAKWKDSAAAGEVTAKYTVTFNSDGGSAVTAQTVEEGKSAFSPVTPQRGGYKFTGWYLDGVKYDFNNVITKDITLIAQWTKLDAKIQAYGGYNESLYVEWSDGAPSQASVQYRATGASTWENVDSELIRSVGSSVARVDVLGITAGDYDVKIQPSGGADAIEISDVSVTAYDRSGYAHFKYTDGVGAYNDDGTLKDDAIVIYVTDENKDTVMRDYCATHSELEMFKIPTYSGTTGKDWGGKNADGIGWWLNNAQYSMDNANSDKNKRPSNTYDAANGKNLSFKKANDTHPIAIRFIGKVTVPEGCTAPNDEDEGGLKGDGGYMARMKNLKNVTIEGVGDDAEIYGWGFHFLAGSDAVNGQGKSFEVRNLKFDKYVEDAVGMEGVQSGGKITGSVDRCWIHNNTFLPGDGTAGGTQSATESDKAEGDGSIDFKRGEYLTSSYNYFADCHKTGLIGSSDSSLQYNISMHHNWYHNCGSRMPLARCANIHFYNNYVSIDTNAPEASYVHSIRANSNLFSEANYYFGCKAVTDTKGTGKGWNNIYLGCIGTNQLIDVKTRDEAVSNNCTHFSGTKLDKFDTDPNLFYYNAQAKQSDCVLDTPVAARMKVMQYAGRNGWGNENPKKQGDVSAALKEFMNDKTPSAAVPVPEEGVLNIPIEGSGSNNVIFNGSGKSGSLKAKSQMVTFMLATEAEVSFSTTSTGDDAPDLVCSDGTVYAAGVEGSVTVTLPAGIYMICAGQYGHQPKESYITALSFKSTANSAKVKLDNLNDAINAIGTVTLSSGAAIAEAQTLLKALSADEITAFDSAHPGQRDKLTAAQSTYNDLLVENAETLISAIGTVDDNSYPAIEAARTAYNALSSALQGRVTNYSTLTAAETAWAGRAVNAINNQINALTDVTGWTVANGKDAINAQKTAYESVKSAYEQLADKTGVTGYDKVTAGLTKLNSLLTEINAAEQQAAALAQFETALAGVTDADSLTLEQCNAIIDLYNALSQDKQTEYASNATYTAVKTRQTALANAKVTVLFDKSNDNYNGFEPFTVSEGGQKNASGVKINGVTFTKAMELSSSASIKFTLDDGVTKTLKLYFTAAKKVKVNGTVTANAATACTEDENNSGYYVLEITVTGTGDEITIAKDGSGTNLLMIEML